jgi:hypothetical protein
MSMREAGAGTNNFSLAHHRRDAFNRLKKDTQDLTDANRKLAQEALDTANAAQASQPAAPPPAPAPAPEPEPEPEPEPSQTLQDAVSTVESREARDPFEFNQTPADRDAERRALTDSYAQEPSYDPEAGIASEEAGNFLNDYKLNLNSKIADIRSQYGNGNGGE